MSLQTVAQEYLNSLWGNPALQYQVTPTTWQTPVTPGQSSTEATGTNPQWGQGYSGSKTPDTREASNAEGSGRESFSMDKWAGQFSPDLSARDVVKAYGKFMRGNPLLSGLAMAVKYGNPTKDPLWQKTAQQYLDENVTNAPSLSSVIGQINQLYNQSLNNKVFAGDTATGTLLGLGNPTQWGQASTYGMQPYEFAQSMRGYNAAGLDPTGANTYEMFGGDMYNDLRNAKDPYGNSYGYSNQAQPSHLADIARLIGLGQAEVDGEYADSMERGLASAAARDLSNEWMGDVLNGRSTLGFNDWKDARGDASGGGWDGGSASGDDDSDVGNRGFGASGDDYY
jgi:hypothetical protein